MTTASDNNYSEDASQAWQPAIDGMDERADENDGEDTTHVDEWQSLVAHDQETDETADETAEDSTNQSTVMASLWSLIPDDSDTDNDGRTGFLSTRVEWHALILGLAAGTHVMASGDLQFIADLVGLGTAGSRAGRLQKTGLPDKYVEQAKAELPYFFLGIAIAFAGLRLPELGLIQ